MDVKKYFLCIIDVKIPFTSACFQMNWFEMQLGQTTWVAPGRQLGPRLTPGEL